MRISGLVIDKDNHRFKEWLFPRDSRIEQALVRSVRSTEAHGRQIEFLRLDPFERLSLDGYTREGALKTGLGLYVPIHEGERLEVEFLSPTFDKLIVVKPIAHATSFEFRIRLDDLKVTSRRLMEAHPMVPFRFMAKVVEIKGSTVMLKEL